jgi:hypothetical protein
MTFSPALALSRSRTRLLLSDLPTPGHWRKTAHRVPLRVQARDLFSGEDAVFIAVGRAAAIRAGKRESCQSERILFGEMFKLSAVGRQAPHRACPTALWLTLRAEKESVSGEMDDRARDHSVAHRRLGGGPPRQDRCGRSSER